MVSLLSALFAAQVYAVDTAPRISDREIIEKLTELKAGQSGLQKQINDQKISLQQQINDLKESTNKRFDTLQWMFGLFITVAVTILGVFGKILWNRQKEMARFNTTLETQKDEMAFLKNLIEKLLSPKGVL